MSSRRTTGRWAALGFTVVVIGACVVWMRLLLSSPSSPDAHPPEAGVARPPARVVGRPVPVSLAPVRSTATPVGGGGPGEMPGLLPANAGPDAIPGEYVFSFYNAAERDAFIAAARAAGLEIRGVLDLGNSVHVYTRDRALLERVLGAAPRPVGISANRHMRIPPPPGPPLAADPGGYIGFGDAAAAWLGARQPDPAWGQGITIAVLDTRIDTHPALGQVTVGGSGGSAGTEPGEGPTHGTAVASLIAGSGTVMGLAPGAKLLSYPVLNQGGEGDAFTLAQAIVSATDAGARIINVCLGTRGDSHILAQAVDYAVAQGAVVVAAAGNDAVAGVLYPARYDGVVAVAAVDATPQHVYFSNRGTEIDIAAPGVGVRAAGEGEETVAFSGTSAAAPFVSGALAVVMSQEPGLAAADAAAILLAHSNDEGPPGPDEFLGAGVLDVERALDRDTDGIYDIAVGRPYLVGPAAEGENIRVTITAQNRGTETLGTVTLDVDAEGSTESMHFYDVGVGHTVSHTMRVNPDHLETTGLISISVAATIDGAADGRPQNNATAAVLTLRP